MRGSLALLLLAASVALGIAQAQTAAPRPDAVQPSAVRSASRAPATRAREPQAAHATPSANSRHARARAVGAPGRGPAPKGDGVLTLGATDITGNKELPKVMVIVPWKDASGAGGVIKPTDSLLDEVLGPVDRGVFQRRIRYYGQLEKAGVSRQTVAPVGDKH